MGTLFCVGALACSSGDKREGFYVDPGVSSSPVPTYGSNGTAGKDGGLSNNVPNPGCGFETFSLKINRPTIHFILDSSGSMEDTFSVDGTRYRVASKAILETVEQIGHRINFALTPFPSKTVSTGCGAGETLVEATAGDALDADGFSRGPALNYLSGKLTSVKPSGGTPITATIHELAKNITTDDGDVTFVLITDGGPNCNPTAVCEINACMLNIERIKLGNISCNDSYNCCIDAPASCLDHLDAADEISNLRLRGYSTYVVGLPGSELYGFALDSMAQAGGVAKLGGTGYYDVTDSSLLASTLVDLGKNVTESCTFKLEVVPPSDFNLYIDGELVPYNSSGKTWTVDSKLRELTLGGDWCTKWKSGGISKLEAVAGCPTLIE